MNYNEEQKKLNKELGIYKRQIKAAAKRYINDIAQNGARENHSDEYVRNILNEQKPWGLYYNEEVKIREEVRRLFGRIDNIIFSVGGGYFDYRNYERYSKNFDKAREFVAEYQLDFKVD